MNGKFILLMVLTASLVSTSALVNNAWAPAGDRASPLIHVYLYFPSGRPPTTQVMVQMGDTIIWKTVDTRNPRFETIVTDSHGGKSTGVEVPFKLPLRTRTLLDLFKVCTYNPSTGEERCGFPFVWWDRTTASDAWLGVYNTH